MLPISFSTIFFGDMAAAFVTWTAKTSSIIELFLSCGRNLQMFDDCRDISEKKLNFPTRLGQILIICQTEIAVSRKDRICEGVGRGWEIALQVLGRMSARKGRKKKWWEDRQVGRKADEFGRKVKDMKDVWRKRKGRGKNARWMWTLFD